MISRQEAGGRGQEAGGRGDLDQRLATSDSRFCPADAGATAALLRRDPHVNASERHNSPASRESLVQTLQSQILPEAASGTIGEREECD